MCERLCEQSETGEMVACQGCGCLICFDVENGDDIIRSAYITEDGDLFCDWCGQEYEAYDYGDDYDFSDVSMEYEDD